MLKGLIKLLEPGKDQTILLSLHIKLLLLHYILSHLFLLYTFRTLHTILTMANYLLLCLRWLMP